MRILIKNLDKIYTVNNEGNTVINNGMIVIRDNKIAGLGTNLKVEENNFDKIIDGKSKIALPGLINTHSHSAMTLLRGYADDLALKEWLENKIWPFEATLTEEDIYWGSKLAVLEMIKTGTTTFLDMYFEMNSVAKVIEESGIRAVLSEGLIEANDGDIGLDSSLGFCKKWQGQADGRITTMLAPHSPYTCSREYLKKISDIGKENALAINIHLAETRKEYDDSIRKFGTTPVKYLNNIGLFDNQLIAAHCVYMNDTDLDIFAQNNINVSYNPSSNMKLGSGIARITDMLEKGINVAFGTDGVGSNNNLDMIEEARIGSYLQKANTLNAGVLDKNDILKMLTINGAKALQLKQLGKIQKGYLADIILVNIEGNTHFYPSHNSLSNLLYAGSGKDVSTVIINGDLIYNNYKFLTLDSEEIYSNIEKIVNSRSLK